MVCNFTTLLVHNLWFVYALLRYCLSCVYVCASVVYVDILNILLAPIVFLKPGKGTERESVSAEGCLCWRVTFLPLPLSLFSSTPSLPPPSLLAHVRILRRALAEGRKSKKKGGKKDERERERKTVTVSKAIRI